MVSDKRIRGFLSKKCKKRSAEASRIVAEAFRAGKTVDAITAELRRLLGPATPDRATVGRERRRLALERQRTAAAHEHAQALLEAAEAVPGPYAELLKTLAQQLLDDPSAL